MSLRVRLFLGFAIFTVIAVVDVAGGYIGYRQSVDAYHRIAETILPAQSTVSELVDMSRSLGDKPLSYAFAQSDADRAAELADFRQSAADLMSLVDQYRTSSALEDGGTLQEMAQAMIDRGEQFIRLVDQGASNLDLQTAKNQTEAVEEELQDLLGDADVSLQAQLIRAVILDSSDTVTLWTILSLVALLVTTVVTLYTLLKSITQPIEQLKHRANTMAGGDYSSRIAITRTDEIGALALAFNKMADAIEKRQLDLLDLNQSLEVRVEERTEALRSAKDEAEAILNNTSDAIVLIDQDFVLTRANHAFFALFGYSETDLPGFTIDQLVEPDQSDVVLDAVRRLTGEQTQVEAELQCRRQDGTEFAADAVFGLFGSNEASPLIIGSFHDITPQKQAQRELQDSLQKEREPGAMKSGFVSLVSHEFRTPLAVIQSTGDLIQHYWDRLSEDKRAEKMKTIQNQISVMTNLLDNFLTVSGVETVSIDFLPVQLDLIKFTRDLIDEMQRATETAAISLVTHEESALVSLDASLLRQILVNLLTNAMKYSEPNAPIEVEIVRTPEAITVHVRDQGIGIPVGDQPSIFKAFHRGTNVDNIHGTGLGLAIVKRAVERHRGTVSFQSAVGTGSTFTVVLPTVPNQEGA